MNNEFTQCIRILQLYSIMILWYHNNPMLSMQHAFLDAVIDFGTINPIILVANTGRVKGCISNAGKYQ